MILLDSRSYICGVEVFAANWDISSAVYSKIGLLTELSEAKVARIYPMYTHSPIHWDGRSTLKLGSGAPMRVKNLWVFDPKNRNIRRIGRAGEVESKWAEAQGNCNLSPFI